MVPWDTTRVEGARDLLMAKDGEESEMHAIISSLTTDLQTQALYNRLHHLLP